MVKLCGARTRSGGECKKPPLNGKTRCKMHGGRSTGPIKPADQKGNKRALKHGIYGDLIREDDLPHVESIQARVGAIDDELLIARLQLRRALRAQARADELTDGLEIVESIEREGAGEYQAKSESKRKRRDYPQIIDRLIARIESLEKTRKELLASDDGAIGIGGGITFQIVRAKKKDEGDANGD